MKEPKYRFVKEYANYKEKKIKENPYWSSERKAEAIETNRRILRAWQRGLLTIDETLAEISRNY